MLRRLICSTAKSFKYIKTEVSGRCGIIRLDRPEALNALSTPLMAELGEALTDFDATTNVGAMVITGSEKAFAAGADIEEMSGLGLADCINKGYLKEWQTIFDRLCKPVIAAVNGYALGGGCELAMMCDIVWAGDRAKLGQPEIRLGTIPGGGGTQRLPRAVGKSKAMEMILTGDHISADEALKHGLVSRILPPDVLVEECVKLGERIAQYSPTVVALCKKAVKKSFEVPLSQGLDDELDLFHSTFGLRDRLEGMKAFLEKRKANFTGN